MHFKVFAERHETSTSKTGTAGLPAVFVIGNKSHSGHKTGVTIAMSTAPDDLPTYMGTLQNLSYMRDVRSDWERSRPCSRPWTKATNWPSNSGFAEFRDTKAQHASSLCLFQACSASYSAPGLPAGAAGADVEFIPACNPSMRI